MNLNELKPAEGSKRQRKRVGRGHGTGWGKTAGKDTMDKNKDQVHMYHLYLKVDKCQ